MKVALTICKFSKTNTGRKYSSANKYQALMYFGE